MIRIILATPSFEGSLDVSNKLIERGIVNRQDILSIEDDQIEIDNSWNSDEAIDVLKEALSDCIGLTFENLGDQSVEFDEDGKPEIPNPIEHIVYPDVPDNAQINKNTGELAATAVSTSEATTKVDMFSNNNNSNISNSNMKLKIKAQKKSFNEEISNENNVVETVETVTPEVVEQTKQEQLEDTANVNQDGLSSVSGEVDDVVKAVTEFSRKTKRGTKSYAKFLNGLRKVFNENPELAQDSLDVIDRSFVLEGEGEPKVEGEDITEHLGEFASRIKAKRSRVNKKFSKYRKPEDHKLFADEYGDDAAENYIEDIKATMDEYADIKGEVLDHVKEAYADEIAPEEVKVEGEVVTEEVPAEVEVVEETMEDKVEDKPVEFSAKGKNVRKFNKTRRKFDEELEVKPEEDEDDDLSKLMFSEEEIGEVEDEKSEEDETEVELFTENEINDADKDEDDEDDEDETPSEFSNKPSKRAQFSAKAPGLDTVISFRQRELQTMLNKK